MRLKLLCRLSILLGWLVCCNTLTAKDKPHHRKSDKPKGYWYSINGPSAVNYGDDVTYTVSPAIPGNYGWRVTPCGFVDGYNTTTADIAFPSSGCTSTTIQIVNSTGGGSDI